jgi:outer membrane lipoprotein-sorting protein
MTRFVRIALAALLALSFAGTASADPRQDLHKAFARNLGLKTFKATMTDLASNKTISVVEFQAPDRYRITVPGQPPSLIIGDAMYINANGQSMKVPMPKGSFGQFRNEQALAELEKGTGVEDLGPGLVGQEPARRYRFRSGTGKQQSSSTVWVGTRSGLILRVETSGKNGSTPFSMRVAYTDFDNRAIRIANPK